MQNLTTDQRKHIARLIESEVGYFNGWSVSIETMEKDCEQAARKVEQYLKGVYRRNQNKQGS